MPSNDTKYIAIDPGGKTTGWAKFGLQGEFLEFGEIVGQDEFLDWLEEQDAEIYILERYRARPGRINSFSTLPTVQLIGAIKRVARKKKIAVHEQDPSPALSIGLRFIGMHDTYKGKHVPDKVSALAHGTYFLRKAKVLK